MRAPKVAAPPQTEKEFQAQVVQLAEMLGWTCNHVRKSIGGKKQGWVTTTTLKGWPDCQFMRPPNGLIFAELKTDTGRVTAEQTEVMELLRACGQKAFIWRPRDWDEIVATLQRPRLPSGLTHISRSPA